MMMSPRLMPIRKRMRRSAGSSGSACAIACCTATAQVTASTTLANSHKAPSPMSLTMRPWCAAIRGSIRVSRSAFSRATVPASSSPTSRE